MMQFTAVIETPSSLYTPAAAAAGGTTTSTSLSRRHPWPENKFNNAANCMEQLLLHCAHAIESNDSTLAQQILWVLHNLAPPDGNSNQRLTSAFLRALLLRASRSGFFLSSSAAPPPSYNLDTDLLLHRLSPLSLACFIDLTPSHRFGFSAANSAIISFASQTTFPILHLVDLTTTHCMQIPTLIDSLSSHFPFSPPFLRLTIPTPSPSPPPALNISLHDLASRLVAFARSRNISMDFHLIPSSPSDGFHSLIRHLLSHRLPDEALVINCHLTPHRIPDRARSGFIDGLRRLDPALVIVVEEEADFTAGDVVGRVKAALDYMWIPFDAAEAVLPAGCEERRRYEAAACWRIENVVAMEGEARVERLETKEKWVKRMKAAGFAGVGFGEEAAAEIRGMLDEHSKGWGMKRDDDDLIMLTWKGHDVVFASAWVPAASTSSSMSTTPPPA